MHTTSAAIIIVHVCNFVQKMFVSIDTCCTDVYPCKVQNAEVLDFRMYIYIYIYIVCIF